MSGGRHKKPARTGPLLNEFGELRYQAVRIRELCAEQRRYLYERRVLARHRHVSNTAFDNGVDAREVEHVATGLSDRMPSGFLVAIAFSFGGLGVLRRILAELPAQFPAAIAVAQHMGNRSWLPEILSAGTRLRVKVAESGESLYCGTIYVCPAQHHLLINPDATIGLSLAPRLRFARPSLDWFFDTVAGTFAERAIGVVLSGGSSDATYGAHRIHGNGGQVFAQDPHTCISPSMPAHAIAAGSVDSILGPAEIAPALMSALQGADRNRALADWEHPWSLPTTKLKLST